MIVNAVRMNHKITQAACESFHLTAIIMRMIVPTQNTMNGCGITCTIARSPPPAAKVIGPASPPIAIRPVGVVHRLIGLRQFLGAVLLFEGKPCRPWNHGTTRPTFQRDPAAWLGIEGEQDAWRQ